MIRGPRGTLYFTEAELRKLAAPPSPWWMFFWGAVGLVAAQLLIFALR
jgi:predicted nicotinamide N-methyase